MLAIGLPFATDLRRSSWAPAGLASVLQAASNRVGSGGTKAQCYHLSYRPVVDSEAFLVRLGLRESFCADSHHIV